MSPDPGRPATARIPSIHNSTAACAVAALTAMPGTVARCAATSCRHLQLTRTQTWRSAAARHGGYRYRATLPRTRPDQVPRERERTWGNRHISFLATSASLLLFKSTMSTAKALMPVLFVSHGGGPSYLLTTADMPAFAGIDSASPSADFLRSVPSLLPATPSAILVVSAHWEERDFTVQTSPSPPMLYDYGGFPDAAYKVRYSAPGHPELARKVRTH